MARKRVFGPAFLLAATLAAPAGAADTPDAKAEKHLDRARAYLAGGHHDMALASLKTAVKAAPDHPDANEMLCTLTMGRADADARGYTPVKTIVNELKDAAAACGHAADVSPDAASRTRLRNLRLRALMMVESWDEAAAVFETLIAASPDDGRLVGGYAAVLDHAGRIDESRAALDRAASRGADFDRAARFEFVWDRFECCKDPRLMPMVAALLAEETDPRRLAVLGVLHEGLAQHERAFLLRFLDLIDQATLNRPELDRLWWAIAGRPSDSDRIRGTGYLEEQGIESPVLTQRVDPVYPAAARERRKSGRVIVLARINVDGTVSPVWVVRAPTTSPEFAPAAVEAVLRRRYVAAKQHGEPIPLPWMIRVDFRTR